MISSNQSRVLRQTTGVTLVELLVVIAIVALLMGLLLPAVQGVRESGRRAACLNNLRQLVVAAHSFHTSQGRLPAGATYVAGQEGDPRGHGHSWLSRLLPHLELSTIHDRLDFAAPSNMPPNAAVLLGVVLPSLACPSDPHAGLLDNGRLNDAYLPGPAGTKSMGASYVPCGGPMHMNVCTVAATAPTNINCLGVEGLGWPGHSGGSYSSGAPGMFAGGPVAYQFGQCTDGLSHTFLIGEQLPAYSSLMHYFSSHLNVGSTNPPPNFHLAYPACPPRLTPRSDPYNPHLCVGRMGGFKSAHPHGLVMGMADGRAAFVDELIDYQIWQYLGNRRDRVPVSLP
jgi:type II secretory pathway pseudopilin PulG